MKLDRRGYLLGAGAVMASLAGCTEQTPPEATQPASPSEELLEEGGWELQSEDTQRAFEETFGPVTVTADMRMRQYEDVVLRNQVKENTFGEVDASLATLVTTRVDFDPDVGSIPVINGEVMSRLDSIAKDQFEAQLQSAGLTNVQERTTEALAIDSGATADLTRYDAAYRFDPIEYPIQDGETVTVEGGEIAVEGLLAIWNDGGTPIIAGGATVADNFDRTVTKQLSSGVSVTVDVDFGFTPEAFVAELVELIQSVD